jgi:hypothetical protein
MERGERGVHPPPADHRRQRDGVSETMKNGIDHPSGGGSLALASNDPRHDGEGFLKPKNVVTREARDSKAAWHLGWQALYAVGKRVSVFQRRFSRAVGLLLCTDRAWKRRCTS